MIDRFVASLPELAIIGGRRIKTGTFVSNIT
jgi:hypothetical protein